MRVSKCLFCWILIRITAINFSYHDRYPFCISICNWKLKYRHYSSSFRSMFRTANNTQTRCLHVVYVFFAFRWWRFGRWYIETSTGDFQSDFKILEFWLKFQNIEFQNSFEFWIIKCYTDPFPATKWWLMKKIYLNLWSLCNSGAVKINKIIVAV